MISFLQFLKESSSSKKGSGSSCIMLYFDKIVDPLFKEIKSKINPKDLYGVEDGYGFESNPHVTVKYGIVERDFSIIKDTLGKIDPIEVKTKTKFSLFENEKYDVLKVNVSSAPLRMLNGRICRIFECEDSYPTYIPHSTICYLQPGSGRRYLNLESDFLNNSYIMNRLVISDPDLNKKYISLG